LEVRKILQLIQMAEDLFEAAKAGNLKEVKRLIEGADIK
jgi:hypothetical protein